MAYQSSMSVDTSLGTVSLLMTVGASTIANIVFTDGVTQTCTFGILNAANLTASEFIDYCEKIFQFNSAIIASFSPDTGSYIPFTKVTVKEDNDSVTKKLIYVFTDDSSEIRRITVNYPNGNVHIDARNNSDILSYAEFIYFIVTLQHFYLSVKKNYKI